MLPHQCRECSTLINNDEGGLCQPCVNKTLNKREIAWQNRKQVKKESHPTYARNQKYPKSFEERMKKIKPLYAFSEEREKFEKKWYKEHGNGWWIFQGQQRRNVYEDTWIEQYNLVDLARVRNKNVKGE